MATPNSGVVEPRNAAFAAVVVLTAYTKPIEARSSVRLPAIIRRPPVNAAIMWTGRWRTAAVSSTTTMIPTDRQIRYWKASEWSARRAVIAPKLQIAPADSPRIEPHAVTSRERR